jgi:hypothetical protein
MGSVIVGLMDSRPMQLCMYNFNSALIITFCPIYIEFTDSRDVLF